MRLKRNELLKHHYGNDYFELGKVSDNDYEMNGFGWCNNTCQVELLDDYKVRVTVENRNNGAITTHTHKLTYDTARKQYYFRARQLAGNFQVYINKEID